MKLFFALAIIAFPAVAGAQQLPSLDVLLDRLDAYTSQYQARLPSLSCEEQITSQALSDKGKVRREVKIQSTLREIRTGNPYEPFREERQIKTTSRRQPKPNMPYFVEGGFAGLVGFKRWEQRECFDYNLKPGDTAQTVRLDMTLKQKLTNASCAKLPAGLHRIVIAESETGLVLHTERTIAPEAAEIGVYFGGIDYAPRKLGEETFWLPSRFYSHDPDNTGRMVATYSNCNRYTVKVKVVPGMPVVEPGRGPR